MTRFASFPQVFPELRCNSVLLRALTEADIPAWYARATDVEAADLAGDPVPESIDMGRPWLQTSRDRFNSQIGLRWAIVPHGEASSVGTVGLLAKSESEAELGVVIARARWSQGIGTAAVRLAVAYAFEELSVSELQAHVLQRNPASIRLLEKAGFTQCGVIQPTEAEPEELLLYKLRSGRNSAA